MAKIKKKIDRMLSKLLKADYKDSEGEKMPSFLFQRFIKLLVIGVLITIMGALTPILMQSTSLTPIITFTAFGLFFIAYSLIFRYRVIHHGYDTLEGEITSTNEKILSSIRMARNQIASFHLSDEEGKLYLIPVTKKTTNLPIHSKVTVFMPKGTGVIEMGGILRPMSCWGFVVNSEPTVNTKEEAYNVTEDPDS